MQGRWISTAPWCGAKGRDVTLITYGGSLFKTLEAAEALAKDGIDAEVIDLRSLRPLDMDTIHASVARTHRALIVDEGWRTGSLAAEIGMRLAEDAFFDLDAPLARVCSEEVPIPYAAHLEQAAIPQVGGIVAAAKQLMERKAMSQFVMPSLGADMEDGTLIEQLIAAGDAVHRGDIIAAVETQKGAIEIEVFEDGFLDKWLVPLGTKVPVGTPIAVIRASDAPDKPDMPQPADPAPAPPPPEAPQPDDPVAPTCDAGRAIRPHQSNPPKHRRNCRNQSVSVSPPLRRRRAAQTGFDLASLGTGKFISLRDIPTPQKRPKARTPFCDAAGDFSGDDALKTRDPALLSLRYD